MARYAKHQIEFKATITSVKPIHLGSGFESESTDMSFFRNGEGKLCIPGTSWLAF